MKHRLLIAFTGAVSLLCITQAQADGMTDWLLSFSRYKEVAPVTDAQYNKECGACHFAYPPGLLPARSWKKLIAAESLGDHFGDSAELGEKTRLHLQEFAVNNAADDSYYKRSRKVMSSLDDSMTPLRITEVPYIKRKHEEIPAAQIKQNEQVKSLSFCNKCHRLAHKGVFDDDSVVIPGHE